MSALVKVFVVFIFLLSVAFFGTSATLFKTRNDWRSAYNTLRSETQTLLADVKKRNDELLSQIEKMDQSNITLKASLDETAKTLKQTDQDYKEEKTKVEVHASNVARANVLAESLAKNLESEKATYAALQESLNKVKSELDAAKQESNAAIIARDSMRLDLEKSQTELHTVRVTHNELAEKFETLELVANDMRSRLGPNAPVGSTPPRPIDAKVVAVEPKDKLVVLSAGRDQKVELGYEFTVSRGSEFIGKVKVIKIFPDLCGAEVMFTKEGAEIQKQDNATTSS